MFNDCCLPTQNRSENITHHPFEVCVRSVWCRNIKQQCYGLFFVFAAKIAFRLVMRDVITSHTNCIQLYYSTRTLMLIFFLLRPGRKNEREVSRAER